MIADPKTLVETLAVAEYGDGLARCRKVITFEPDDLEAAITETDRLHAEVEAGEPPTR